MNRKEALSQFINQIHGRAVVVKLNSGVDYRGLFLRLFQQMFVFKHFLFFQVFSLVSMDT